MVCADRRHGARGADHLDLAARDRRRNPVGGAEGSQVGPDPLEGQPGHLLVAQAHRHASAAVLGPFLYQQILSMTLLGWLVFDQVLQSGSLVRAAQALNLTQPAVTKIIHELESYFEAQLLVGLVEAAQQVFLADAEQFFALVDIEVVGALDLGVAAPDDLARIDEELGLGLGAAHVVQESAVGVDALADEWRAGRHVLANGSRAVVAELARRVPHLVVVEVTASGEVLAQLRREVQP